MLQIYDNATKLPVGSSVTVNTAGAAENGFAYATLSTPVSLSAIGSYYVENTEVSGGDYWYDYNSTVEPSPGAIINGAAIANRMAGTQNQMYVPIDMLVTYGP